MEKEAKMQIIIRQETPEDYKEVYELIAEAFASAEHADGNEQDLVVALRKGNSFIPELSLVAVSDGVVWKIHLTLDVAQECIQNHR